MSENPTESFDRTATELIPLHPARFFTRSHCGHPSAAFDPRTGDCNCLVCARCGRHTGNTVQGHYWAYCTAGQCMRRFHFCCPGNCALEVHHDAAA